MNTQKSVFNKISKIEREVESKEVELSEQKIELSLYQDIIRFNDIIKQEFKQIEKEGAILGTALADAERQRRKFVDIVMSGRRTKQQAEGLIQDFKKAAADLGADFESSDIKEMQKLIIEIDEYIKFANGIGKVPQI